mgnify:CR=1 FL=1
MVSVSGESPLQKVHAGSKAEWPFSVSTDGNAVKISFSITTGPDASAPDWDVTLCDASKEEIWGSYRSSSEIEVDVGGKAAKELYLCVECPRGARYGDAVEVTVTADDGMTSSISFRAVATQSIMILKTQIDQEKAVAQALYEKANAKAKSGSSERDVYAILSPAGLRGYVFVEGMNTNRLNDTVRDIKKARNFVKDEKTTSNSEDRNSQTNGEISIEEISPYLVPVSAVVGIVEGDIVELVNGPFKGEKARVQQIDQAKEEITVELIEAMVPIPVTVKGDSVRIIEKER